MSNHQLLAATAAVLASACLLTKTAGATIVNIYFDGYEGYADTAALQAAWPDDGADNGVQTLVTGGGANVFSGSQSLQLGYSVGDGGFIDRVVYTFDADQDWSAFDTFTFRYKGLAGNSDDRIFFELRDGFGGTLGNANIASGTLVTDWTLASIDISGYGNLGNGTSLANVRSLVLGVNAGNHFGSGTVFFDEVGAIPEPSTAVLIVLGAALIASRHKRHSHRPASGC